MALAQASIPYISWAFCDFRLSYKIGGFSLRNLLVDDFYENGGNFPPYQ
ncbi:MAG: hypothetical protein LBJ89_00440 [Holosporales bacterium]|jgi:hypothetical protein|nr:hypothetical protein [Holosporales bacterium]